MARTSTIVNMVLTFLSGVYLSQLNRHNKLPALIDPTDPHSVIWIEAEDARFDPAREP